jgi:anti-sigma factor RsiW
MPDAPRHPELEDLSAWLDGELDEARAADVERALERDRGLAQARRETEQLGRLLGAYTAPEPAADLAERALARVRQASPARPRVIRLARWLVPAAAAAAAAIIITVILSLGGSPEAPQGPTAAVPSSTPPAELDTTAEVLAAATPRQRQELVEDFAVHKLDMLRDYEVVANFEVLAEIEKIEKDGGV